MNNFITYKNAIVGACAFSISMIASGVLADDTEKKMTRSEKALAKFSEQYIETGETKKCLSSRRIRSTNVLSNQMILFRMYGSTDYIMKLRSECPGLFFENRFSYRIHSTQLCGMDFITVLDSFGRSGASCGLGDFVAVKKRPDEAPSETFNQSETVNSGD